MSVCVDAGGSGRAGVPMASPFLPSSHLAQMKNMLPLPLPPGRNIPSRLKFLYASEAIGRTAGNGT